MILIKFHCLFIQNKYTNEKISLHLFKQQDEEKKRINEPEISVLLPC